MEFQGPIVSQVAYTTGGETLNITYTAVTNIELRSTDGFEVNMFDWSNHDYLNLK